jgi:hypothetical protein
MDENDQSPGYRCFATISLLYDWMFGTLDNGDGYRNTRSQKQPPAFHEASS